MAHTEEETGRERAGVDRTAPALAEPRAKELVFELWERLEAGNEPLSKLFEEAFSERWLRDALDQAERGRIVGAIHTILRREGRVVSALNASGQSALLLGSPRARSAALHTGARLIDASSSLEDARRSAPDLDAEAFLAADRALGADPDPLRALTHTIGWPEFLARPLFEQYGGEAQALALALARSAPIVLRVNTLATTPAKLAERLQKQRMPSHPGELAASALVIEERSDLFKTSEFHTGLFEQQDEASQLVAELVAPPPKSLVIDLCAGAGGKTLAIAALLQNKGRIIACDTNPWRLKELERRAARAKAFNVQVVQIGPAGFPSELEAQRCKADRVLVDAPCTGLGALRRKPERLRRTTADELARLPAQQIAITRTALELVRPGGRLIYATCTIFAAENERVVEQLLEDPRFELVLAKEILGGERATKMCDASGRFLRLLPHIHGTDGFFAAVLRRKREARAEPAESIPDP